MQQILDENSLRRKNNATVNLKTGRFDNINSAVIINSVSKAVQNWKKSPVAMDATFEKIYFKTVFLTRDPTIMVLESACLRYQ